MFLVTKTPAVTYLKKKRRKKKKIRIDRSHLPTFSFSILVAASSRRIPLLDSFPYALLSIFYPRFYIFSANFLPAPIFPALRSLSFYPYPPLSFDRLDGFTLPYFSVTLLLVEEVEGHAVGRERNRRKITRL